MWKTDISVWVDKPSIIQAFSDDGEEQDYMPERTCEIIEYPDAPIPVCSECGAVQPDDYTVNYCWCCGARVSNDDLAPENGVTASASAVITGKRHHVIGGSE